MAVLSDTIRQQCWRGLMRYWSAQLESIAGITKTDLQAAVNAADDWANTNAASYNTALPAAFKANATATQKALLLAVVCLARFSVPELRRLLGEID
jgi:hypothetical protein